nr:alpha/beta hydrolase [Spirulina major]
MNALHYEGLFCRLSSVMPAYTLPADAAQLTESTSIAMARQIQVEPILTPLSERAIASTYVTQGTGQPPILLLHGFDSSLLEYRRLLPFLSEQHQVWAMDLLNFGFTERRLDLPAGTEAIKTHIHAFWQHFIRTPMILVGASMGGAAALDFALSYPEIVQQVVLLDSAGLAPRPIAGKLMIPPLDRWATNFLSSPKVREKISRKAYYNDAKFVTEDANLCAALHVAVSGWNQALVNFTKQGGYGSFKRQLPHLQQPTLIAWGAQDAILGTKNAPVFERLIPNSELVWIPEAGHVPHLEQPETVAAAMVRFIAQHQPQASTSV